MDSTIEAMINELSQEAATTKRILERVPEGQLSWRPHAKSMTLGQLALHVTTENLQLTSALLYRSRTIYLHE